MNVELTKKAKRQLGNLPKSEAKKVARKLFQLERSPFTGKKLAGKLQTRYSLKAWPYRIIYVVDKRRKIVQVEIIEHRQGVYT